MPSATKEYNGWSNYETWAVNLWTGNEEPSYRHWSRMSQDAWDGAEPSKTFTREERAAIDLADCLKSSVERNAPKSVKGVYADLLGAALSEVNWMEIAKSLLESVDKTQSEE